MIRSGSSGSMRVAARCGRVAIRRPGPARAGQRQRSDQHERRAVVEQRRNRAIGRHAAEHRADDHARAERERHDAHVVRLVLRRAQVGDRRLRDARQPASSPVAAARQQQRDARVPRAGRHHPVAGREAEHAQQQDPAAAVAIGQVAHQRRAEEHAQRVDPVAETEVEIARMRAGVGRQDARVRIAEDRGHHRIDERSPSRRSRWRAGRGRAACSRVGTWRPSGQSG